MRDPGSALLRREGFALVVSGAATGGWLHQREAENELEVIVGGDSIVTLEVAGKAAVHNRVLTVWPKEGANRLHQAGAAIGAIARHAPVYVARVEAVRAVIAVAPSEEDWSNHGLAVLTTERLFQIAGSRA